MRLLLAFISFLIGLAALGTTLSFNQSADCKEGCESNKPSVQGDTSLDRVLALTMTQENIGDVVFTEQGVPVTLIAANSLSQSDIHVEYTTLTNVVGQTIELGSLQAVALQNDLNVRLPNSASKIKVSEAIELNSIPSIASISSRSHDVRNITEDEAYYFHDTKAQRQLVITDDEVASNDEPSSIDDNNYWAEADRQRFNLKLRSKQGDTSSVSTSSRLDHSQRQQVALRSTQRTNADILHGINTRQVTAKVTPKVAVNLNSAPLTKAIAPVRTARSELNLNQAVSVNPSPANIPLSPNPSPSSRLQARPSVNSSIERGLATRLASVTFNRGSITGSTSGSSGSDTDPDSNVDDLADNVDELSDNVSDLSDDLDDVKGSLMVVETQVQTVQDQVGDINVTDLSSRFDDLGAQFGLLERKTFAGIASTASLVTAIPSDPGKTIVNVGYGHYEGENAIGVSVSKRLSRINGYVYSGVASGLSDVRTPLIRVGVGVEF